MVMDATANFNRIHIYAVSECIRSCDQKLHYTSVLQRIIVILSVGVRGFLCAKQLVEGKKSYEDDRK